MTKLGYPLWRPCCYHPRYTEAREAQARDKPFNAMPRSRFRGLEKRQEDLPAQSSAASHVLWYHLSAGGRCCLDFCAGE
jgi:hypothetical protein